MVRKLPNQTSRSWIGTHQVNLAWDFDVHFVHVFRETVQYPSLKETHGFKMMENVSLLPHDIRWTNFVPFLQSWKMFVDDSCRLKCGYSTCECLCSPVHEISGELFPQQAWKNWRIPVASCRRKTSVLSVLCWGAGYVESSLHWRIQCCGSIQLSLWLSLQKKQQRFWEILTFETLQSRVQRTFYSELTAFLHGSLPPILEFMSS